VRWIVHCSRYYFADFGEYRMISLLGKSLPRESSTPGLEVELVSSEVADKKRKVAVAYAREQCIQKPVNLGRYSQVQGVIWSARKISDGVLWHWRDSEV
jgi:hypothetical protein